jgi:hypothetical protein
MNDKVKVGLDEWVVADAGKVDLVTDGLSGCVAVGLAGNGRVTLTHVYSDCTADNWPAYRERLEAAIQESGIAGDDPQEPLKGRDAVLVFSDDQPTWLSEKLNDWLEEKGAEVDVRQASGCMVSAEHGSLQATMKNDFAPQPYFDHGFKTTADVVDGVIGKHALSGEAKSAGAAAVPDQDVMLSNVQHPAHALYRHILDRIPPTALGYEEDEVALARGSMIGSHVAAALTVECMKRGMFDPAQIAVDDTAIKAGGEVLHAGANLGTLHENRAGVNVGEAEEKSMSAMSAEAAQRLQAHQQQAQNMNPPVPQQGLGGMHQGL